MAKFETLFIPKGLRFKLSAKVQHAWKLLLVNSLYRHSMCIAQVQVFVLCSLSFVLGPDLDLDLTWT